MITLPFDDQAFFPNCILPDCLDFKAGIIHQHILPEQQRILDSTSKYLYSQSGVGGGKSTAFAVKCVKLSLLIPENKGVVSRLHYDDLFDSSWRDVMATLNRLAEKNLIPEPTYKKKVQGEYTEIKLHNLSELKAIQGKNWSRGLGASHGWFWVDDAMESQEEFFIGTETTAGLLSRLRIPHVRFIQGIYDDTTRPHGMLHGMVSSNPPPINHWLHKLFGNKPGIHNIGEDIVEWIGFASSENPFMGANYSKGIIAVQHKMGRSANVIRRVIGGESIPAYGGIPVFPQFDHKRHVAALKFDERLPLLRSWDFGHDHPAVVFSNIYRCKYGTHHYLTLSEVADAFNITVDKLYENYVKKHTDALYKKATRILDAGDRAGYRSSSSNKDGRGDMQILMHQPYNLAFKYRYINLEPSLQYMRGLLDPVPGKKCKCGLELALISNKCPVLIGALEGGYRFPKPRTGPPGTKPYEDRYFADVACAWRYGAENYIRFGVSNEQKSLYSSNLISTQSPTSPLPWLQEADEQFAARLLT